MSADGQKDSPQDQLKKLTDSIVAIAVEYWRLMRVLMRLLNTVDAGEQQRYQGKIRWFSKKTEEALNAAGLSIVNYEGHPYDPGIPASPVNLEDFQPDDKLYVTQMLEPVILDAGGNLVKAGTIALGRVEE